MSQLVEFILLCFREGKLNHTQCPVYCIVLAITGGNEYAIETVTTAERSHPHRLHWHAIIISVQQLQPVAVMPTYSHTVQ